MRDGDVVTFRFTPADRQKSSGTCPCGQTPQGATSAGMRRVVIVAFPRVQTLDVHGPAEVFTTASQLSPRDGYAVEVVSVRPGPLPTSSVALYPDRTIDRCKGPIDTLLVAGGRGVHAAAEDARLVAWLRAAAARSQRVTLGLHRRLPARRGRPARRPPRHHALGLVRRARPAPSRGRGRARPDLRARRRRDHLGGRDRGHGPRARAGGGGPRPRRGARDRPLARAVPQAPRRPGAVQRPARRPDGRPRAAARAAGVDAGQPRRGPVRARAGARAPA